MANWKEGLVKINLLHPILNTRKLAIGRKLENGMYEIVRFFDFTNYIILNGNKTSVLSKEQIGKDYLWERG